MLGEHDLAHLQIHRSRWNGCQGTHMSQLSWLQKQYWAKFGQPAEERNLFKFLVHNPVTSILEVGIGNCQRMRRIAKLAHLPQDVEVLRYIGTDEFEAAADSANHLSLKQAHQIAGSLGFKASLIPGDAGAAIPRVAHKMGTTDLIIVDGGLDPKSPTTGVVSQWLNRLAHEDTVVFAAATAGEELQMLDRATVEQVTARAA